MLRLATPELAGLAQVVETGLKNVAVVAGVRTGEGCLPGRRVDRCRVLNGARDFDRRIVSAIKLRAHPKGFDLLRIGMVEHAHPAVDADESGLHGAEEILQP